MVVSVINGLINGIKGFLSTAEREIAHDSWGVDSRDSYIDISDKTNTGCRGAASPTTLEVSVIKNAVLRMIISAADPVVQKGEVPLRLVYDEYNRPAADGMLLPDYRHSTYDIKRLNASKLARSYLEIKKYDPGQAERAWEAFNWLTAKTGISASDIVSYTKLKDLEPLLERLVRTPYRLPDEVISKTVVPLTEKMERVSAMPASLSEEAADWRLFAELLLDDLDHVSGLLLAARKHEDDDRFAELATSGSIGDPDMKEDVDGFKAPYSGGKIPPPRSAASINSELLK